MIVLVIFALNHSSVVSFIWCTSAISDELRSKCYFCPKTHQPEKHQLQLQQMTIFFILLFFFFQRKQVLTFYANHLSAKQTIHMKCQDLFSLKNKKKYKF